MRTRTWLLIGCAVALVVAGVAVAAFLVPEGAPSASGAGGLAAPDLALESQIETAAVRWYTDPGKSTSALETAAPLAAAIPRAFNVSAAMGDVRALADFGPRGGGSAAEAQAAEYLRSRLEAIGLDARIEPFPLADGRTSRNVIARIPGSSAGVLVLGAHYDTKPPSPGANDNASGCAVLLEIAEVLHEEPASSTVEIVFFGAEEMIDQMPDHHHYGSRYRVAQMSAAERKATVGMISVDMIGYGTQLNSLTMGTGPQSLSNALLAHAKAEGVAMSYRKDSSRYGLSDHEPYERAGIPAACVSARKDPTYHTEGDVASHLSTEKVATVGELVLGFVREGL